MNLENHTPSTMDLSNQKHNPASSLLPSPPTSGMKSTVTTSQDFPSVNSQAPVTYEFLGISSNGNNGVDCPYSEIYPIIVPVNEDDYFADNAFMDMFRDPPFIEPRKSQEISEKKDQDCNTQQVAINIDDVKSEQFMSEPQSATTNTKRTLTCDNIFSQDQRSSTPPEILFGHIQKLNNQLPSPANYKRQKTSNVNQCKCRNTAECRLFLCVNTPDDGNKIRRNNIIISSNPQPLASNDFNVDQRTSSSVKPTRGCKCTRTSCSNGYCACYRAKAGCSSKTCECHECKNSHGRRKGSDIKLRNSAGRRKNKEKAVFHKLPKPPTSQFHLSPCTGVDQPTQRALFHELLQPAPLQLRPSSPCTRVDQPTQRASFRELLQPTPLQFHQSPCSWVQPTQRASFHELPKPTPLLLLRYGARKTSLKPVEDQERSQ